MRKVFIIVLIFSFVQNLFSQPKWTKEIESNQVQITSTDLENPFVRAGLYFGYKLDSAFCSPSQDSLKAYRNKKEIYNPEKLNGFHSIVLTREDIGKRFTLANDTFEIVNIFNNHIVLKSNIKNLDKIANLRLINFISDAEVTKPIPSGTIKNSSSIKFLSEEQLMWFMTEVSYENVCVKKDDFANFIEQMKIELDKNTKQEEVFVLIMDMAEIGNKFILYRK